MRARARAPLTRSVERPQRKARAVKIVYLVHDADDPAIARRVRMLKLGGARPVLAGFRRSESVRGDIEGAPIFDLGRTEDAKLVKRAGSVAAALFKLGPFRSELDDAEVVIARNLEMLALARALLWRMEKSAKRPRLVYECLDIHRVMIGKGVRAKALRALERALMGGVDRLMVSSPAFVRHYFEPMQGFKGDWLLVENKVLIEGEAPKPLPKPSAPPWRIGWFGVLRCQKSLDMLCALAKASAGEIEIVLRGKPAYHEFRDFDAQVQAAGPHLRYLGPYRYDDLAEIYADVHYAWAVDFFDEGANSDWLLPNRLYEAGAHGVPLIARCGTEAGRVVEAWGCGLSIDLGSLDRLKRGFETKAFSGIQTNVKRRGERFTAFATHHRRLVHDLVNGSDRGVD